MGTLDITTIQDSKLRRAAEAADSGNGKTAYNNKLDSSELSVFIKEASKTGCNTDDINDIIQNIGVAQNDKATKQTISEFNELNKMRSTIATRENELAKRKGELQRMEDEYDKMRPKTSGKDGEDIGFWAGGLSGTAASLKLAKAAPHPILKAIVVFGGFMIGAGVGAGIGKGIEKLINYFKPDSHSAKVQSKNMNNYKESAVEPLEAELDALKKQLKEKENKFYE